MSELRLNPVTREWVIIAKERARRPEDFRKPERVRRLPGRVDTCPFCPGNEDRTPKEHFRLTIDGRWAIRVVDNKYPALVREGTRERRIDGLRRSVTGVGVHEVIIESPLHNMSPALLETERVEELIGVYRDRFVCAHRDPRVEHVIIFKNHGEGAGTSLVHPHSQLIGTPVVPLQFRDRVDAAMHYFDDTGECLICDILRSETTEGVRIIMDTEHFSTFIPYAALSPFHTWIMPRRHSASFSSITDGEMRDLAHHLRTVLAKFYYGLDDPDYNYVIRSSRPRDVENEYCHWYVSIVPRLVKTAGFELGSGMFINTSLPEESAAYLRSVNVE